MTGATINERLLAIAEQTGRPVPEVRRHHVLEGLLRRLGTLPDAAAFVLRGSMLTRIWARPQVRPAKDLDFLGLRPADAETTAQLLRPAFTDQTPQDGVVIDSGRVQARGIWQETAFPGVRLFLRAGLGAPSEMLQIDIGFNDPLVPPAELVDYPTLLPELPARLWCVRPETMAAWKLHGLVELGERRWRPKDLDDLLTILNRCPLDQTALAEAIEPAFVSRGYRVESALPLLTALWWRNKLAQQRWEAFRREAFGRELPAHLTTVIECVAARLRPVLSP